MYIEENFISQLKELLGSKKKIAVVSHANPDGDAIGSGLAWTKILQKAGHEARFIVPNDFPGFLGWITDTGLVNIFRNSPKKNAEFIESAELVFCLDFNQIHRIDELGEEINKNTTAKKILIDHHLDPPKEFDITISDTSASSTSFLVYKVAESMGMLEFIDKSIAEALYVGISTDTGNFSFGNLTPELYRCVAGLVEKGVNTPVLNIAIYNNFSRERMKLLGYLLDNNMKFTGNNAAYITLSKEEQNRYEFKQGDNEGFVNFPLSIKEINLSAFFMETNNECVKISLRSQGDIDVNVMAGKYFNGGGHKNASGGKFCGTIEKAVEAFELAVRELG